MDDLDVNLLIETATADIREKMEEMEKRLKVLENPSSQ